VENYSSIGAPTFSVVIPLYQKRHRIETCLASIRAQTCFPLEIIVVDDGSTDGGGDVVQKIGGDWVRYVRQTNQGVSAARNAGIVLARGSHIALIDADDTWNSNHLAVLMRLAARHPEASIIGTSWSENGKVIGNKEVNAGDQVIDLDYFLLCSANGLPPFWSSAVAIRKSVICDAPLFPVGSRIAEDQDAWLTLLALGVGFKSSEVTADYFYDNVSPTVTTVRAADFDSVIFTKWSVRTCYDSKYYWKFVAAHRLYTLQRHIGHSPNGLLLKYLLQTKTGFLPLSRLIILTRILLDQARRWCSPHSSRETT
jgi:glycosyltransferase involved in cell wall biosynthesis